MLLNEVQFMFESDFQLINAVTFTPAAYNVEILIF